MTSGLESAEGLIVLKISEDVSRAATVPGERLLFRTDWHERYGTPEYRDEHPKISRELTKWRILWRCSFPNPGCA